MKPAFIYDQPEHEYRKAKPHLSQTFLKNIINKSPAHAIEAMNNAPDSVALRIGSGAHCLILEGEDEFNNRYAIAPECDRRTKAGKQVYTDFMESIGAAEVLQKKEADIIHGMAKAINDNDLAKALFQNGKPEVSAFGLFDNTQIKGRFDYFHPSDGIIIDLKTCQDATPEAVSKYALKYGLHIQQAVYSEIYRSITKNELVDFVFVMVEKAPPHGIAVFRLSKQSVTHAKAQVIEAMGIYRQCVASGEWPGYQDGVLEIDLPSWYYMKQRGIK